MEKGILYLVATPIGNLNDMTYRAVETLKEVDEIAAEDTRQTLKLLNHFEINKPMFSYHRHNEDVKTDALIEKLLNGQNIRKTGNLENLHHRFVGAGDLHLALGHHLLLGA